MLNEEDDLMDLPPGFRFHPTDEEIITHYLTKKVVDKNFGAIAIAEVDMNKCEPWDLPSKLFLIPLDEILLFSWIFFSDTNQ